MSDRPSLPKKRLALQEKAMRPNSKTQHSKNKKTLVEYIAVMKLCPEA